MRWRNTLGTVLAASLVLGAGAAVRSQDGDAARVLGVTLEVERDLLQEDRTRHAALAQERNSLLQRLAQLYRSLDAAVHQADSVVADSAEVLIRQIDRAEQARADQLDLERLLVERIRERSRRLDLLQAKSTELESQDVGRRGPLAGEWTVTLLPTSQRGVFTLHQSGTLVSGTYRLEGNWSGSLQGTLVDRKLHLLRIDSKLGRSMEFDGFVSADLNEIRGSWQSYDVSGSAPSGQWTARRRVEP